MEATLSAIKFNLGSVLWDGDGKWSPGLICFTRMGGNGYVFRDSQFWGTTTPPTVLRAGCQDQITIVGRFRFPWMGLPRQQFLQHKSPPSIFLSGFRIQSGLGMDSSPTWDVRNPSGMAVGGGVGLLLSTVKFGPRVYVGLTDVAPMEAQFDQEAHGTRVCRAQMG